MCTSAPLVELVDIIGGGTPDKSRPEFFIGEIPWVTPKDMKVWEISDSEDHISSEAIASSSTKLVPTGSVLVVVRSGVLKHTLPVAITTRSVTLNQDMKALVCRNRLDPRFLAHFLRRSAPQILRTVRGTTADNIPLDELKSLSIPLLTLLEQRRIAAILDKADAIRRKRKEAIVLADELLRSTFLEMFGDPVANPKGWPVIALGETIECIEAGWSANGESRQRTPDEYGVLKVSAVTSGVFLPQEHKAVPADSIDRNLVTPRAGDLLFSRANTRELVAATCLVERDEPRLFLPDKLWRIVPRRQLVTSEYLRFLLAHDGFRAELTKTATGTSGSMQNVSMEKLRTLRGPIPPVSIQRRFTNAVQSILRTKARCRSAESDAAMLFSALVKRAFSGELTC